MEDGKMLILMPQTEKVNILVYNIPDGEVDTFSNLLPKGTEEISFGVFVVPNLIEAEESCDSLFGARKVPKVELT